MSENEGKDWWDRRDWARGRLGGERVDSSSESCRKVPEKRGDGCMCACIDGMWRKDKGRWEVRIQRQRWSVREEETGRGFVTEPLGSGGDSASSPFDPGCIDFKPGD